MTFRVVRGQRTGGLFRVQGTCGVTDVMNTPDPRASTTLQQTERAGSEPAPPIPQHHNEGATIMTNTISDLDLINGALMGGSAKTVFGRDVEIGTQVTGEIVAVQRRHRRDRETGELLFWVNRKPTVAEAGQPVYDNVLLLQTDLQDDDEDDGMRSVYLDRDVQAAIRKAVLKARADGIAIGGVIEGLMYVGQNPNVKGGRIYDMAAYNPPAAA
ncbi:hypothetical protein [Nocardia nova]|uniref:hypothetical protein n=1 Tax=Nocardia nova TaxID=37330 RepID=UPI001894DD6D|nr:hypothetical protein [Nocardia nova]MBF6150288.1 hypothetical protein [Nocardia nova]